MAKKRKRGNKKKTAESILLVSSIINLILRIIELFELALEFFEKFLE